MHKSGWNAKVTAMSRDHVLLQAFASELKAQRSALKLSQEEFAHRADVNRTYVAKLELAQNQPTLSVMHRLAVALNTELPDLTQAVMQRYKRTPPEFSDLENDRANNSEAKLETGELSISPSVFNNFTHEGLINVELKPTASQGFSVPNRKVVVEINYMYASKPQSKFNCKITEIAAVEILDGNVTGSTFHVYLNPGDEADWYPPSSYRWPREFLAGKPKFADIANTLVSFIKGSEVLTDDPYPYLDKLSSELINAGFAPLGEISTNIVNTFTLTRKLLKIKSPTLEKLCNKFEVDPSQYRLAQGCMADARLRAEIYVRMCPVAKLP